MATETDLLPVRKTLNEQFGIGDERIGYDPNTGYVTVDNQNIFKPPTNQDGTTYAGQDMFNSATGQLNTLNNQYKLMQQVTNPQAQVNPVDERFNQMYEQLFSRVNNPTRIDRDDAYDSAQYEAARDQIQRQAQQAIRGTQEALGASGFGRSTMVTDRAQRIQNDANQQLETQIVPGIISELQAAEDRKNAELLNLLGVLGQQQGLYDTRAQNQFGNQFDVLDFLTGRQDRAQDITRQDQRYAVEDARNQTLLELQEAATTGIYKGQPTTAAQQQALQNAWAESESMGRVTPALAQLSGGTLQAGEPLRSTIESDRTFALDRQRVNNESARINLAQAGADFQRALQIFNETGQIPNELAQYGINVDALRNKQTGEKVSVLYQKLLSKEITPQDALAIVNQEAQSGALTSSEAEAMIQSIYSFEPSLNPNIQPTTQGGGFVNNVVRGALAIPQSAQGLNFVIQNAPEIGQSLMNILQKNLASYITGATTGE